MHPKRRAVRKKAKAHDVVMGDHIEKLGAAWLQTGQLWLQWLEDLPEVRHAGKGHRLGEAMSLTYGTVHAVHGTWHQYCIDLVGKPATRGEARFEFDAETEAAGPVKLVGPDPAKFRAYQATDLTHERGPVLIPGDHVVVRCDPHDENALLVTVTDLKEIIEYLPAGTYRGELRYGATPVAKLIAKRV